MSQICAYTISLICAYTISLFYAQQCRPRRPNYQNYRRIVFKEVCSINEHKSHTHQESRDKTHPTSDLKEISFCKDSKFFLQSIVILKEHSIENLLSFEKLEPWQKVGTLRITEESFLKNFKIHPIK